MRIVLIYILALICISCNKSEVQKSIWYAPKFGIIQKTPDSLVYYNTKASGSETWLYDEKEEGYSYTGSIFYNCKIRSDFFIQAEQFSVDSMELKSSANCFPNLPFGRKLILSKMPSKPEVDFKSLRVKVRINGVWQEKEFLRSELLNINTELSALNLQDQLWLIFNSELDFTSKSVKPLVEMELILNHEDGQQVKLIHSYPNPIYLRDILDHVLSPFEGL